MRIDEKEIRELLEKAVITVNGPEKHSGDNLLRGTCLAAPLMIQCYGAEAGASGVSAELHLF
ncbi:hypothetical protein [Hymenobacter crusticola]|uniref:hypothetical protein n=1 Tax=Hymenobacter crusticola TaxID=1770526 RepID=UPI000A3612F4|nr:hypothetical protein [Hymenobacter crusticola]